MAAQDVDLTPPGVNIRYQRGDLRTLLLYNLDGSDLDVTGDWLAQVRRSKDSTSVVGLLDAEETTTDRVTPDAVAMRLTPNDALIDLEPGDYVWDVQRTPPAAARPYTLTGGVWSQEGDVSRDE